MVGSRRLPFAVSFPATDAPEKNKSFTKRKDQTVFYHVLIYSRASPTSSNNGPQTNRQLFCSWDSTIGGIQPLRRPLFSVVFVLPRYTIYY